MDKVAVLIPCYNEELTIGKVVKDFKTHLPEAVIYVYDNNSTDKTADIAKEHGAIVRYERKQGKGNVMRSMFRDIDAECYILVDGDDTYPAEAAPELVFAVTENGGGDLVIGDRLSSTYFTENKRLFHNSGNVLVKNLINKFFKSNIKDIMTGYRGFSYEFVKTFPVLSQGFEIETEMTIHALDKNFSIKSIPIQYRDRPEGSQSKLNTYKDGFKVIMIFNLYRLYKPFQFFSLFALLFLILSVVFFIPVFIDYTKTGIVPKFPSLIVSTALFVVSALSFSASLILDSVRKNGRQQFEIFLNMVNTLKKEINNEFYK